MKNILREFAEYIASWKRDLLSRRDFRGVFEACGLCAIAVEAEHERETCSREAHVAEVEEAEGINCIEHAIADGLQPRDLPELKRALRHLKGSLRHEHNVVDRLA